MNKSSLLHNVKQYFDFMIQCRAYPFPETFQQFEKEKLHWHSEPEQYPCIAVYTWQQSYSGRDSYGVEFIYLEDFEYKFCEHCQKLVPSAELEWRYKIAEGDNTNYDICASCQKLEDIFYD